MEHTWVYRRQEGEGEEVAEEGEEEEEGAEQHEGKKTEKRIILLES